jgi:hypothetical protein
MAEPPKGPRDTKESPGSTRRPGHGGSSVDIEQLLVTLDAATHDVLRLEKLASNGQPQDLSEHDWAELTDPDRVDDIIDAVQDAYEAGVADGLGESDAEDDVDEDLVLLRLLVEQPVRHLRWRGIRRALLRRMFLRQVLRRAREAPSADQRRRPIAKAPRNGSASHR